MIALYDDAVARRFEPFATSRPLSEMRAGALLIRERWETVLGVKRETAQLLNLDLYRHHT